MVLCFVALAVFAVLGIFSARYRALAREAFACVARRVTLRPCESRLEERLKAKIVAKIVTRAPRVAVFVNKRFEVLSWVFTIVFFASFGYSAYSIYNFVAFGNCNGPQGGLCLLDVFSEKRVPLSPPPVGNSPFLGPVNASVTVIEFGCFTCPYTRQAELVVKQFLAKHGQRVRFAFKYFPILKHAFSMESALAAECAREQNKFWEYKNALFSSEKLDFETLENLALELGLNSTRFNSCLESRKYASVVEESIREGIASGVYGTPTFFVNNASIVGPPSLALLEAAIAGDSSAARELQICPPVSS